MRTRSSRIPWRWLVCFTVTALIVFFFVVRGASGVADAQPDDQQLTGVERAPTHRHHQHVVHRSA